jgi:hypothetical protein
MSSEFIAAISRDAALTPVEITVLDYVGVRSVEEVDALVRYFPSLTYAGLRVHHISSVTAQMMSAVSRAAARAAMTGPPPVSLGANPPPGTPTTPGSTVVAVSLPVFVDPMTAANGPNNWTTPIGWLYGRVLNPPPRSIVVGGHCVCVTGFAPDQNEPNGGHFIIRNSWATAWGSQAPASGAWRSPEAGYGEISASYV